MFTTAIKNSPCFTSKEPMHRINILPLTGEVTVILLITSTCLAILFSINTPIAASYALIGVVSGSGVALFGEFVFLVIQSTCKTSSQPIDEIFGWGWGIPTISDVKENPKLYLNEQGNFCTERLIRFAPLFYRNNASKLKGVDDQGRQFYIINFLISENQEPCGHGIVLLFQNESGGDEWNQVSQIYGYGKQDAVVDGFEDELTDIAWMQRLVRTQEYDLFRGTPLFLKTLHQYNTLSLMKPKKVYNSESKGFFNFGFRFLPDVSIEPHAPLSEKRRHEKGEQYFRVAGSAENEIHINFFESAMQRFRCPWVTIDDLGIFQGDFCIEKLHLLAPLFIKYNTPKLKGSDFEGRHFYALYLKASGTEKGQRHVIVLFFQNKLSDGKWNQFSQAYDVISKEREDLDMELSGSDWQTLIQAKYLVSEKWTFELEIPVIEETDEGEPVKREIIEFVKFFDGHAAIESEALAIETKTTKNSLTEIDNEFLKIIIPPTDLVVEQPAASLPDFNPFGLDRNEDFYVFCLKSS